MVTDKNALAVIGGEQPHPMVQSQDEYRVLLHMAQKLLEGGLLPRTVDTPQKVLTIILKGRELGVPPTYALSNIAVINGKPAAGAELLLALVYRAYDGNALRIAVTSRERCVVRYQRPEWPDASELEWTIADAKDAGLLASDAWKKYPATMLRWRAISAACKLGFPEVIGGLYTPEELGGRVEVNEAGEAFIDSVSDSPARLTDATVSPPPDSHETDGEHSLESPYVDEVASEESVLLSEWDDMDEPQTPLFDEFVRATPAQLQSIDKLRGLLGLSRDIGDLSSDQANEMIARLSKEYTAAKAQARRQ